MFNEYEVFQMMKLRQEETERNARDAWKLYLPSNEKNDSNEFLSRSKTLVTPCCPCPSA
jgi:hypothetical protein